MAATLSSNDLTFSSGGGYKWRQIASGKNGNTVSVNWVAVKQNYAEIKVVVDWANEYRLISASLPTNDMNQAYHYVSGAWRQGTEKNFLAILNKTKQTDGTIQVNVYSGDTAESANTFNFKLYAR